MLTLPSPVRSPGTIDRGGGQNRRLLLPLSGCKTFPPIASDVSGLKQK